MKYYMYLPLWFNQTGCLWDQDRDRDRDMNEWILWLYVEPFTLHLNKDRSWHLLSHIGLVPVPVPAPVQDTASVITPLMSNDTVGLMNVHQNVFSIYFYHSFWYVCQPFMSHFLCLKNWRRACYGLSVFDIGNSKWTPPGRQPNPAYRLSLGSSLSNSCN